MSLCLSRHAHRVLGYSKRLFQKSWIASDVPYLTGSPKISNQQLSDLAYGKLDVDPNIAAAGFTNYEEGIRNFKLDIPTHYNFCKDVIDKWAAIEKEELAEGAEKGCIKHLGLWWADENGQEYKWTYSDLSALSKRIAYILTNPCALRPGDHLMVMMTSYPQYWLIFLGCIRAGIVVCPSSNMQSPESIKQHLVQSKAKCIITDNTQVDKVDQIASECPDLRTKVYMPGHRSIQRFLGWFNYADLYRTCKRLKLEEWGDDKTKHVHSKADDKMVMFFTSGTAGNFKVVEHSHASYGLASVINGRYWYDQTRDDITWTISDGGWAKLVWGMLGAWHQGACIFAYHYKDENAFDSGNFDPEKILKTLESYPVTSLTTSSVMWRKIVQEYLSAYTGHRLRHAFSGGEVLNPEVVEKFEAGMGCRLYDGYGQTENSILLGHFKCLPRKDGSLGKPAPGYQIAILDDDGNELPTGCRGHIAVKVKPNRPPGLFIGYFNDPVKTAQCYLGDYYLTGDTGYCDEDGYFWFVSRKEDLIQSGGHLVSPCTVENSLMEHPSVAECAVVSTPDHLQLSGQAIKAFVVLSEEYKDMDENETLQILREHSAQFLQPYEVPQQIEFISNLPTTAAGKLKRSALRRQEWAAVGHIQQ